MPYMYVHELMVSHFYLHTWLMGETVEIVPAKIWNFKIIWFICISAIKSITNELDAKTCQSMKCECTFFHKWKKLIGSDLGTQTARNAFNWLMYIFQLQLSFISFEIIQRTVKHQCHPSTNWSTSMEWDRFWNSIFINSTDCESVASSIKFATFEWETTKYFHFFFSSKMIIGWRNHHFSWVNVFLWMQNHRLKKKETKIEIYHNSQYTSTQPIYNTTNKEVVNIISNPVAKKKEGFKWNIQFLMNTQREMGNGKYTDS